MAYTSHIKSTEFIHWFRSVAPYVNAFRGRTFVVAFGGEVVADGAFVGFTHDLNLLASLGVRLVLVHGARPQIESLLERQGIVSQYVEGMRVTDDAALQCAKEAVGRLRVEIEALFSMGLPNSPMANASIRVASGNYVTAKPIGVVDGIDLLHTGAVRKVDGTGMRNRLDQGEMVLLSPLGYSPTGEVFNLTLEDVAGTVAAALNADKLIFLTDTPGIADTKGTLLRELTAAEAEKILARPASLAPDIQLYLPRAVKACKAGVSRVHFVSRHVDGALLMELFTHEGVGSMITQAPLENLRVAQIEDVGGILQLIEPLEVDGTLVRRSRELLEMEIDRFVVLEHDRIIIACAALYPFPAEKAGELACLAVRTEYRDAGRGDRLLQHIEASATAMGIRKLYVLTTRTAHWFVERGFVETAVDKLPKRRQALYNLKRRSKVFVKKL